MESLDVVGYAIQGTARIALLIGLIVGAVAIYLSPLIIALYYKTGAPALLIVIMMIANIGVLFWTPQIVAYAASAVLWSACAIIAAMAAIASEAVTLIVNRGLKQMATEPRTRSSQ